jgi:hypothetical protein
MYLHKGLWQAGIQRFLAVESFLKNPLCQVCIKINPFEGEGFGRETCRRDLSTSSSRVAQVESLSRTVWVGVTR